MVCRAGWMGGVGLGQGCAGHAQAKGLAYRKL